MTLARKSGAGRLESGEIKAVGRSDRVEFNIFSGGNLPKRSRAISFQKSKTCLNLCPNQEDYDQRIAFGVLRAKRFRHR